MLERVCAATRYGADRTGDPRPCVGGPTFDVVYRSTGGDEQDRHPACFQHGMAEVDRHYASAGMARCDLEPARVAGC